MFCEEYTLKRYERLADQLSELIKRGDLPPGARIPSVRAACKAWDVSPTTVFRAYYLLVLLCHVFFVPPLR